MLHDAWIDRLRSLKEHGHRVSPRGQQTYEQLAQSLAYYARENLLDVPARKLNYRFAVAEWIWMSMGLSDVETVAFYNSQMRQFSDDGVRLTGAYGPHLCAQRTYVTEMLRRDPDTRQAVIEILRPRRETKDEPCTLSLQFLQRNRQLHTIVTMRSSDAWLGIPYDAFTFGQVASAIAGELGVDRGWVRIHMGSSHLYARDRDGADVVIRESHRAAVIPAPKLPGWPPSWFYEVVTKRDRNAVPFGVLTEPSNPWRRYVEALFARTSDEALEYLKAGINS